MLHKLIPGVSPRWRCALSVALLLWPLAAGHRCHAGDDLVNRVFEQLRFFAVSVTVDYRGKLAFNCLPFDPQQFGRSGTMTSDVYALSDPHIQNELRLDLEETLWIDEFRGRHKPVFGRLQKKADAIVLAARSRELLEEDFDVNRELGKPYHLYVEFRKKVNRQLEDHFSPEVWHRFKQLQIRRRILKGGILVACVVDHPIRKALGVDESVVRRLEARCPEIREEIRGRVAPLFAKLVKEVEEVLTEQQRADFRQLLADTDELSPPDVEHLLWQCLYAQKPRPEYADEVEELAATSFYEVAPCGQIRPRRSRYRSLWAFRRAVRYSEKIGLEDVQFEGSGAEFHRRMRPLYEETVKVQNDLKYGRIDRETASEKLYDLALRKERAIIALELDRLLPFQVKLYKRMMQRQSLVQRGLLPALTNGQLGNHLKITDAQRTQLRDIAGKYAPKLQVMSRELESYVWQQIGRELSGKQRERLARLVGKPPTKMAGSPTLLVLELGTFRNAEGLQKLVRGIREYRQLRGLLDRAEDG